MSLLVFYFSLAIAVSFLCSILEAVLLSITPSFTSALKEQHPRLGARMEALKAKVDQPLAAILSLNTIAHTVGAAGVGAQAQVVFENLPFSIISGVLTLLILFFSEIIPKTLGAVYWRQLAAPTIYILEFVILSMWPLVALSRMVSRLIARDSETTGVSRDEIHAMAKLGEQEGVIDKSDARMLQSVMDFQRVKVAEVFTPRTVVKSLDKRLTIRQVMELADELTYSRYPVLENAEKIAGYVLRSDILQAAVGGDWDITVASLTKDLTILPEQMPVKSAFKVFLREREHLAAVVDEFGAFSGVVTLEDVLETLIGHEIMDEGDTVEDLREFARRRSRNIPDDNPTEA
jgi:CBS domain containing-hemolysin-like protein